MSRVHFRVDLEGSPELISLVVSKVLKDLQSTVVQQLGFNLEFSQENLQGSIHIPRTQAFDDPNSAAKKIVLETYHQYQIQSPDLLKLAATARLATEADMTASTALMLVSEVVNEIGNLD